MYVYFSHIFSHCNSMCIALKNIWTCIIFLFFNLQILFYVTLFLIYVYFENSSDFSSSEFLRNLVGKHAPLKIKSVCNLLFLQAFAVFKQHSFCTVWSQTIFCQMSCYLIKLIMPQNLFVSKNWILISRLAGQAYWLDLSWQGKLERCKLF